MIAVFLGPTLDLASARSALTATYLPPVSQGDVYRVARQEPEAIGIVDGYFESVPSVWHKEILWAMARGIPVYGCASMGALRAAELELYGMVGVGAIFADVRDCVLEDDDEVAVWHGDAASGYRQLSDALVDIRCCVARAAAEGVLAAATAARLIAIGKDLHFKDRCYATILALAQEGRRPQPELAAFRAWLRAHGFSQKRRDALDMLRVLREHSVAATAAPALQAPLAPTDATPRSSQPYAFENTAMWNEFRLFYGDADSQFAQGGAAAVTLHDLLDEVRLQPELYRRVCDDALLRLLALQEYRRAGEPLGANQQATADRFRRERGLHGEASLRAWCVDNAIVFPTGLRGFFEGEAALAHVRRQHEVNAWYHVADRLRAGGELPAILQRARDKRARQARAQAGTPASDEGSAPLHA